MLYPANLPPLATIPPHIRAALDAIMTREGTRYEDDPDDPGGATKCGISLAYARASRLDVDGDGDTDVDDIRAVTPEVAQRIIYEKFYQVPGVGRLPEFLQPHVLDMAFNMGLSGTRAVLTSTLTWAGSRPDHGAVLPGFGAFGLPLAAAVGRYGAAAVGDAMVHERIMRYRQIVSARPISKKYLNGWTLRALYYASHDYRSQSQNAALLKNYKEIP